MGDFFAIRYRFYRSACQHRTDSSTLVKDQTEHPGKDFCGASRAHKHACHRHRKMLRTAVLVPDTDETAQRPKVNEQDAGVAFTTQ